MSNTELCAQPNRLARFKHNSLNGSIEETIATPQGCRQAFGCHRASIGRLAAFASLLAIE